MLLICFEYCQAGAEGGGTGDDCEGVAGNREPNSGHDSVWYKALTKQLDQDFCAAICILLGNFAVLLGNFIF